MNEGVKWAGVMAVCSAIAAAATGILVVDYALGNPVGSFDVLIVPPATVAASLLGGVLWWALVERPRCLTNQRATAVGFLVGLLAHPLTWVLYIIGGPLFLSGGWSRPLVMGKFVLTYTVLSALFSGALTIIGGVLCGLVVIRCRRYASALP